MLSRYLVVFGVLLVAHFCAAVAAQPSADTLYVPADSLLIFGWTVEADGDRLLVGAHEQRPGGRSQGDPKGTVFVYRRVGTGWEVEGRLLADRLTNQDCFSWSLDLQGDLAAVGAECEVAGGNRGAVYLYRFDGTEWVREAKLGSTDAGAPDAYYFGGSVALGDGYLAVGALAPNPSNPDEDGNSGAVYVFEQAGDSSWIHATTLTNGDTDSQLDEWFGSALVASADTLLVGAPGDDAPGASNSGAVYVFERTAGQWGERAKLQAPLPVEQERFGHLLALHAGDAVIGTCAPVVYAASGREAGWTVRVTLPLDAWPSAVAIHDGRILTVDWEQGYLFERAGLAWAERARFPVAPYSQWRDEMVSLNDAHAFIGRPSLHEENFVVLYEQARLTANEPEAPGAAALAVEVAPNPTRGYATVRFALGGPAHVRVTVYDVLGRNALRLFEGTLGAGRHELNRSDLSLAPGFYVVRLTADGQATTQPFTVLR